VAFGSRPVPGGAARSTSDGVPEGGTIWVFRALPGLGDLLCATLAFRALLAEAWRPPPGAATRAAAMPADSRKTRAAATPAGSGKTRAAATRL